MSNLFKKTFLTISRIGAQPGDNESERINKSLLVISAIPFIITGIVWGTLYISWGEIRSGLIPLVYAVFSTGSIVHFGITHQFSVFRFSQLILILLLPFILMLSLGGFVKGSGVVLWSLISPLGALLFYRQATAPRWMVAYIIVVALSLFLQPLFAPESRLTEAQVYFFFVLNFAFVGALIFMMVYYFVSRRNFYQARSEALLLNILPVDVAEELKTKGRIDARYFPRVTVLFTDFVNFTNIAERMSPAELVAEIDVCFKAFDEIMDRYQIEKIKTIGDSYMAATGFHAEHDESPQHAVRAALDILDWITARQQENTGDQKVSPMIRIGIHTGPVVAGIVGLKKFAYDIWGDTVNIASRMESSSETGRINISGDTHALVKDHFLCTERGKIQAKNKGEMEMYFVEGEAIL